MEWVSVHLMADTPKSKTWRLYKTGIMVKVSQYHTIITKLQTDRAVYFHSQLKEELKYSPINITKRLQKQLII
jgi:L-cysteine desulfidase